MRRFTEFVEAGGDRMFDEMADNQTGTDWYERRHELEPGMIFTSCWGIVKLDGRTAGDGTKWDVLTWYPGRPGVKGYETGHWSADGGTIEPGDLYEQFEDEPPAPRPR